MVIKERFGAVHGPEPVRPQATRPARAGRLPRHDCRVAGPRRSIARTPVMHSRQSPMHRSGTARTRGFRPPTPTRFVLTRVQRNSPRARGHLLALRLLALPTSSRRCLQYRSARIRRTSPGTVTASLRVFGCATVAVTPGRGPQSAKRQTLMCDPGCAICDRPALLLGHVLATTRTQRVAILNATLTHPR